MSQNYPYSISTDFPNDTVSLTNLQNEIRTSAIVTALDYISSEGDTVNIVFKATLSSPDKTILDGNVTGPAGGLIANHNHIEPTNILKVEINDERVETNGKWRFHTPDVIANTGPDVTTVNDYTFDNPISLLNIKLRPKEANEGDKIDLYLLVPDTGFGEGVIGVLSAAAETGANFITVPLSIINNVYVADHISLKYGGTEEDLLNIISIDKAHQKLYFKTTTTTTFPAGTTLVKLKRYAMKDFTLGPPDLYELGKDKIGTIYVKTGYIARVEYTNRTSVAKTLYCILAYLE